jgi:phage protein U
MFDTDEDTGALATAHYVGFVTRDVTTDGPTLADHVYPGRLELPFEAGDKVSVEKADAVAAEGSDYILISGTGAITSGTAVGTQLSFVGGKFRVKQSADVAYFTLAAQLTPEEVGNSVRIRAEAIR